MGYNDLLCQSDTLLLTYVFFNFQDMYFEIYELGPALFFSTRIIIWQAAFFILYIYYIYYIYIKYILYIYIYIYIIYI